MFLSTFKSEFAKKKTNNILMDNDKKSIYHLKNGCESLLNFQLITRDEVISFVLLETHVNAFEYPVLFSDTRLAASSAGHFSRQVSSNLPLKPPFQRHFQNSTLHHNKLHTKINRIIPGVFVKFYCILYSCFPIPFRLLKYFQ